MGAPTVSQISQWLWWWRRWHLQSQKPRPLWIAPFIDASFLGDQDRTGQPNLTCDQRPEKWHTPSSKRYEVFRPAGQMAIMPSEIRQALADATRNPQSGLRRVPLLAGEPSGHASILATSRAMCSARPPRRVPERPALRVTRNHRRSCGRARMAPDFRAAETHLRSRYDGLENGHMALHACRQHLHLR
jgi:hypothetical protein